MLHKSHYYALDILFSCFDPLWIMWLLAMLYRYNMNIIGQLLHPHSIISQFFLLKTIFPSVGVETLDHQSIWSLVASPCSLSIMGFYLYFHIIFDFSCQKKFASWNVLFENFSTYHVIFWYQLFFFVITLHVLYMAVTELLRSYIWSSSIKLLLMPRQQSNWTPSGKRYEWPVIPHGHFLA